MTTPTRLDRLRSDKLELEIERLSGAMNPNRTFYFNSMIVDSTTETCIEVCERWSKTPEPITVMLQCPGGSIFSGFALFDYLVELGKTHEVETCAFGYAASMAATILQAGTKRTITPNSYVMIHEAGTATAGSTSQMRDQVDLMERMEKRIIDIIADRSSGLTSDAIIEATRRKDWWLDAAQSLKLGLVDEIRHP